ncbi:MAG: DUF5318 domain-containing protein [Hamadaea sp.]|nr:DUF5318 domain-containing protein [Hamadaea sp.]
MRTQRQVVDYALQRRALLREVYAGRVRTSEVCDASSYLKTAARFHGEPTEDLCPVCRREFLTRVHYIYGDELKQSAGQARSRAELATLAMTVREFQVFVVEVCRGCSWNHLVEQFLLGTAEPPADRRRGGRSDATDPAGETTGTPASSPGGRTRRAAARPA